jgi:NADPH-dependent curcumin reductase CurA
MPSDGDFAQSESVIPKPGAEQVLTRTIYLSLDPYQWGRRRRGEEAPGEVCHGRTVSQVLESKLPAYAPGDYLFNTNGWQTYGLSGAGISIFGYMLPRKLDPALAPISTALGAMGMLGLTAYAGVYLQCQPQAGETVVVSAASGGVGQLVGQIAKLHGCRVVGIAGAAAKCNFVIDDLGFDACVSHLSEDLAAQLATACPDGIDIYFENVGGKVFDAVLPLLNPRSRVTRCGLISQYANTDGIDPAASWLATGQATFERCHTQVHALLVRNFVADYQERFFSEMADWIRAGKVKYREDLWSDLDSAPQALSAMLKGANFGKTLIAVGDDPSLNMQIANKRARGNILA